MAAARVPLLAELAEVPSRAREALGSILVPDWALWRLGETSESRAARLPGRPARPAQLEVGPAWAARVAEAEEAAN